MIKIFALTVLIILGMSMVFLFPSGQERDRIEFAAKCTAEHGEVANGIMANICIKTSAIIVIK